LKPLHSSFAVLSLTGGVVLLCLLTNRHVAPDRSSAGSRRGFNRIIAKVGSAELRSQDLQDVLRLGLRGQASEIALTPQNLAVRESAVLEHLIEDEILAQAARSNGLKTMLHGTEARRELSKEYVEEQAAKLPPFSEVELRDFYKNHGEKFYVPPAVQARQLFLPLNLREAKDKKEAEDSARKLGLDLATRIRQGQPLQKLVQQYTPASHREKAEIQTFRGGVMETSDEQKVLSLRPGEVVGPLRVEGGYCIFQGVAKTRGRLIPFFQARANIRTYLEEHRMEETRQKLLNQLRQQVSVERFDLSKPDDS
jgi:hypothetical protein